MAPRLHHRLSITHVMDREQSKFIEAVSGGWPRLLSNLKSLLETRENRPENPASRWMMGKPKNAVETGGFESRHGVAECRHYARVLRKSRRARVGSCFGSRSPHGKSSGKYWTITAAKPRKPQGPPAAGHCRRP
jgi:hypothetical protein